MRKNASSVLIAFALASCTHGAGSVDNGLPSSPAAQRGAGAGVNASGVFRVLHSFKGGSDAADPSGPLVLFNDRLWGTTFLGGDSGDGTIFSYNLKIGKERVAYSFQGGPDQSTPRGGLILLNGLLYGTIGGLNSGAIFSFDPATDQERVLHTFSSKDGTLPIGGLTAVNGILYGTASLGGIITPTNPGQPNPYGCDAGCGTFFSLDPASGSFQVIYSFTGSPDGSNPQAAPVAVNGTLYGTTAQGGDPSVCGLCGTVYGIDIASGQERVVYSFEGDIDGEKPTSLMFARGRLYGTTSQGGNESGNCDYGPPCGTVFSIMPSSGLERVVYRFGSSPDGAQPIAALVARDGNLYGTAQSGGTGGAGTIFSIDMTTRAETTLFSFPRSLHPTVHFPLGCDPSSPLLFVHGIYYGTTMECGPFEVENAGSGTLFAFKP